MHVAVLGLAIVGCRSWFEPAPTDPAPGLDGLVGTTLDPGAPPLVTFAYDRGSSSAGPFGAPGGLRVQQVMPGTGDADPLQVVAIFDRPMVPLTNLDTMAASVPVTCTPDAGFTPRWAGTTTAVLVAPREGLPAATHFDCRIPEGTTAVDGTALRGPAAWSFETPTLGLELLDPPPDSDQADPREPIRVRFDQDVDAVLAERLLTLTSGGAAVPFRARSDAHDPRTFLLEASLAPDRDYLVTLPAGSLGVEGALVTPAEQSSTFRTCPPLAVVSHAPVSGQEADTWLGLQFTTAVSSDQVREHLTITPEPPGWDPPRQSWAWQHWGYGIGLLPQTTYTVTLSPGLEDDFGQVLAEPYTWTFTTGDRAPSWSVPSGLSLYPANNPPQLPFRRVNLERLEVRAASVRPDEVGAAGAEVAVRGAPWMVPHDAPRNVSELELLELGPWLSADGFGWIGAAFSSPDLRPEDGGASANSVLVVTDLGATVKLEPSATLVFVTSLSTGAPVPDVAVSLRSSLWSQPQNRLVIGGELPLGKTGPDGVLRFEGQPEAGWNRWEGPFAVLLRKGNDQSVVFADWSPDWGAFRNDGAEVRAHGFADRGLYRLGDPLHAHASFRLADRAGLAGVQGTATWKLRDDGGADIATGEGPLAGDGTFDVQTTLPTSGALGDWSLRVEARVGERTGSVQIPVPVKAYRPAAFRVEVSGPAAVVAGESVTLHADGRYLFGAPMNRASVVFRGYARAEHFRPDGFDTFDFGPELRWWEEVASTDSAPRITDVRAGLVEGAASFEVAFTDPRWSEQPYSVDLEAEVTDVDQQVLAASHHVTVLPAAYGVGLRPTSWVAAAGEQATVEVVAVSGDGVVVGDRPVELSVVRRSFDSLRERGMDGRWRYVTTTTDTPVTAGSVRTGAGPVRFSFTPSEAGLHVFVARSTDDAGRTFTSEASIYVAGADASWARSEGRAWLVADQKEYAPGDTARVVVKGHVPGSWALVTVEREGVLWKETRQLQGSSPVLEIPIPPEWVPGVTLSVAAVTGAGPQDAPDRGRPELVFGTVALEVDASDRHLEVDVQPAAKDYRPRDEVSVSVAVRRGGAPAPDTAVTLYAVDESVLSLTAYETPDAFEAMYRPHATNVVTLDNRQAIFDRAAFLTKGANPGGGGGSGTGGPELRTKFLTTIAWEGLRTGPDGKVEAKFQLPDNLTEFRVMAVAEQADAFGADDERLRVSRPLVLRAALPRVLREGDESFSGVVVHNHTDTAHAVTVTASVVGPARLEGSPMVVQVPAEGAVQVPFRVFADEPGAVEFTFRGEMAGESDGLVASVPVRRDVALESVGTSGLVVGTASERLVLPDGVRPGVGGLAVTLGTTALAGTDDALGYLVEYPYGCVEQVTSRGMGALAVLAVRDRTGSTWSEEALRGTVTSVLDRLPRYRTWGGYAYWPGGDSSYEGTRYVLEFLAQAKRQGFAVDPAAVTAAVDWLRDAESSWEFGRLSADDQRRLRAEIAIGLAAAGQSDAGRLSRVYAEREQLSLQLRAELLSALLATSGRDARTAALAADLAARSYVEAAAASVREPRVPGSWGSDDRTTAAVLAAFVQLEDQPLTPRYALHLAQSRRSGRWHDTRATAAVLLALAEYAKVYETAGTEVEATLHLAGRELLREKVPVPGTRRVDVALADLVTGSLDLTGDRVYWASRLTYAPLVPTPREEGFWLDRRLELVDGGGPNGELIAGSTVRVTLTVATPAERFDVAVRDPFPAGFEVVDTSLATTSLADREREGEEEDWTPRAEEWGGRSFDHHELDDGEVRLFARALPAGIHTYRYVLRATAPGRYTHPPARVEEMYEPENFGSTGGASIVIGR